MALLSVMATAVSVWAVWLVRNTLNEAIAGNEIAREAKRAWIGIEEISLSREVVVRPRAANFTVRVTVKNHGESPAFDVGLSVAFRTVDTPFESQDVLRPYERLFAIGRSTVFPQKTFTFVPYTVGLGREEYDAVVPGDGLHPMVFLVVSVTYKLAGEKTIRSTKSAFELLTRVFEAEGDRLSPESVNFSDQPIYVPDVAT